MKTLYIIIDILELFSRIFFLSIYSKQIYGDQDYLVFRGFTVYAIGKTEILLLTPLYL